MDDRTPPSLDSRSLDDVVAQTTALARAYTAPCVQPWRPRGDGTLDFGAALVRLFARMVDPLIKRLNQVPAKHLLAFTDLLGASRVPPRAARVPVTFHVTDGSVGPAAVPAGSQVAAAVAGAPVSFETESDLALTRAGLAAVFVLDPVQQRYADRTTVAMGQAPGSFAALGVPESRPIEHEIHLAVDPLVTIAGAQQLTVSLLGKNHPFPALIWAAWSAQGWVTLPSSPSPDGHSAVVTTAASQVGLVEVNGRRAYWLRAATLPYEEHVARSASVTVAGTAAAPDAAALNAVTLDVSKDLQPFGERPRFNDAFFIGSDAAFATAGAALSLTFTTSAAYPPAGGAANSPQLAWEVWDGKRATKLTLTQDTTQNFTSQHGGVVTFTLGAAVPRAVVAGVTSRWIRVRLVSGDYGHDVSIVGGVVQRATFAPPSFASVALGWTGSVTTAALTVLRRTDATYEDVTAGDPATQAPPNMFDIHRAEPDIEPALYLGFDRAFEPSDVTLYLQVAPPSAPDPSTWSQPPPLAKPPLLAWESWNGAAWTALTVDDGTESFTRSGLVVFRAPSDAAAVVRFGQSLFWLRARAVGGAFAPMPSLGRVLTNTAWASHGLTTKTERLGASNGAAAQTFALARAPVLDGQRIEVSEADAPPDDELAKLRLEEGVVPGAASSSGDVVSIEIAASGAATYWVRWHAVPDFWASGPRDRHYVFDAETGGVTFGDGRRGLVPPVGIRNVRAAWYRSGGGVEGNVAAGAITQLKSSLPLVDAVTNVEAASGGAPIEDESTMIARASHTLRHGDRAVTSEDFADLAREASRDVARAVTITPSFSPIDQGDGPDPKDLRRDGQVIVVVVAADTRPGASPTTHLLAEVQDYLTARAGTAALITVTGPHWVAVDVTVHVVATRLEETDLVLAGVRAAVTRLLDPFVGGDGSGWPFGRRPRASDLVAAIDTVAGVDHLTFLDVRCDAPFDGDDTTPGYQISIDQLSLEARLLVFPRSVVVASPAAVTTAPPPAPGAGPQ
jgi:hypothetical protein